MVSLELVKPRRANSLVKFICFSMVFVFLGIDALNESTNKVKPKSYVWESL